MKAHAAVPPDRRWGRAGFRFRFRFRFLCHLAAGLLLALPALAQRASGDTLPAALQGVRQAGQQRGHALVHLGAPGHYLGQAGSGDQPALRPRVLLAHLLQRFWLETQGQSVVEVRQLTVQGAAA